jgi:acyl carrier protein phosphodiesterase
MNFLAHLFLTPQTKESHIGSLLADFTRIGNGHLHNHFSPGIAKAVIMHRKIDVFTDSHPDVGAAVNLLFNKYRHYSRIVVDIYFDHFLTINWSRFSTTPMDEFIDSVHQSFATLPSDLPEKFCLFTRRLRTFEILAAYGPIEDLKEVFNRTEMRIKSKPGIDKAWVEMLDNYVEFDRLFKSFFPQLLEYLDVANVDLTALPRS